MLLFPFYAIGFLLSIAALVGWFYFQRRAAWSYVLRFLFFAGLVTYLLSVLTAGAPVDFKMSVLFRDLLFIAGAGWVSQFLVRKRPAFFLGLLALGIVLVWFYKNHFKQTFPYVEATSVSLDEEAELLIELKEGADLRKLDAITHRFHLSYEPAFELKHPERTELDDYYAVDIPAGQADQLQSIEKAFRQSGVVDWVEPNEVINLDPVTPVKLPEKIRKKFGINDPGLENLWGFDAMEIDKLYEYLQEQNLKPGRKALVAILDTGVDAGHEDIKSNYKSVKKAHDNDPRGHGTHCAGIAAAVSNNGLGVASFARDNDFVEVTSIKVLSAMGSGTQRSIINGMLEAADNDADVISMSLGGRSNQSRQRAYIQAVNDAGEAGTIVVAAAGNSNDNAKDYAPVNAKGVIGVSALDEELKRAVFSNFVSDLKMGIAAPGVNIYSTIPGDKYATYSGTSMATPYVSGLIGLLKAIRPELTAEQAHRILVKTGNKTEDTSKTGKLIQPFEAVKMLVENKK